jgi:hypothetical protein
LSTSGPDKKARIRIGKFLAAGLSFLLVGATAFAADNTLLIQLGTDGHYRVWHVEGETHMSEEEILAVSAGAKPEGGEPARVAAGTARGFQTDHGVVIEIPDAKSDRALLVDRDECGAIKVWHAEGATILTEEQTTELVLSALPGGGRPVKVAGRYAKAFVVPLGYAVVIWQPVVR